jgi:hypothetical protein
MRTGFPETEGVPVRVMYSLPITIQVNHNSKMIASKGQFIKLLRTMGLDGGEFGHKYLGFY